MSTPDLPGRSPRLRPLTPKLAAAPEKAKKRKVEDTEDTGEALSKEEKKRIKREKREKRDKKSKKDKSDAGEADEVVPVKEDSFFKDLKDDTTDADAQKEFMEANEIVIHDPSAPGPCIAFKAAPFPSALVKLLSEQGFPAPSAVQGAAWPVATTGRDILAVAKTGSGKTLGYLMPALTICHEHKSTSGGYPICLVMSPTRELAMQIETEATKYGKPVNCRAVCVYGGAPKWQQTQKLQRGCEVVVATPGRMLDMLDLHGTGWGGPSTNLDHCRMLILDEADRMLDMGFEKDIMQIVENMKMDRQTMLFTATWPKAVQRIAASILKPDKVKVTVGTGGDKLTANKSVKQTVTVVEQSGKWDMFLSLMENFKPGGEQEGKRCMIFCNTKKDVNAISEHFWKQDYSIDSLSGDRTQRDREDVIAKFRRGTVTMVVATDVAARGLDINGIERVINYDFPRDNIDDYIHRIGRTGRAGATGAADTLFTRGDSRYAKELVRILTEAGQDVSLPLEGLVGKGGGGKSRGKGKGKGGGKGSGKGGRGRW